MSEERIEVVLERDPLAPTQALVTQHKLAAAAAKLPVANGQQRAADWVELAQQLGLATYERQPEETDTEWYVWETYRSRYPMRPLTYTELAQRTGIGAATCSKIAAKWKFRLRMLDWSRHVDAETDEKRIDGIKEMNKQQLDNALALQEKAAEAISMLDPAILKPNEILGIVKLANDTQRRIVEQETLKVEAQVMNAADIKAETTTTDAGAMNEILAILGKTGALGRSILGVEKKTTTTERVLLKTEEEVNV